MYVCIEVALRGDAHGIGRPSGPGGGTHQKSGSNVPTGPGEGLIGIVGPISQPRGTIDTGSLTLDHTYALNVRFLNQL